MQNYVFGQLVDHGDTFNIKSKEEIEKVCSWNTFEPWHWTYNPIETEVQTKQSEVRKRKGLQIPE